MLLYLSYRMGSINTKVRHITDDLLKRSTLIEMAKFGAVGGSGMGINLFLLWVITEAFHIHYMYSAAIAIVSAGFWNFVWNKYWTFTTPRKERPAVAPGFYKEPQHCGRPMKALTTFDTHEPVGYCCLACNAFVAHE